MIRLERVSKYFPTSSGRKYVLRDVSLVLPFNKNIGVIGRNGAGKSTLLRLIGGIEYPSEGRIFREGNISWPLGLMGGVQGSLTGRDNARFVCRVYGADENEIANKLNFIHEFSELGAYFDMPVKSYSSGMSSRLKFATSMAFDFDTYLIDELTAVGDKKFRDKSRAALEEKKGLATIIKVSHNLKSLAEECESALYLHDKNLFFYDDINDAINAYYDSIKS